MGATPNHILAMVFSQFARLLGLALLLGLPIGYFLMQRWIGEFSYQATLGVTPSYWHPLSCFSWPWQCELGSIENLPGQSCR